MHLAQPGPRQVHSSKLGMKQESTLFKGVFVCRLSVRNDCVRLGAFADDDFENVLWRKEVVNENAHGVYVCVMTFSSAV